MQVKQALEAAKVAENAYEAHPFGSQVPAFVFFVKHERLQESQKKELRLRDKMVQAHGLCSFVRCKGTQVLAPALRKARENNKEKRKSEGGRQATAMAKKKSDEIASLESQLVWQEESIQWVKDW